VLVLDDGRSLRGEFIDAGLSGAGFKVLVGRLTSEARVAESESAA
jgi:hypothetical protein